jgi:hypothetical protein
MPPAAGSYWHAALKSNIRKVRENNGKGYQLKWRNFPAF